MQADDSGLEGKQERGAQGCRMSASLLLIVCEQVLRLSSFVELSAQGWAASRAGQSERERVVSSLTITTGSATEGQMCKVGIAAN